VHLGLCSDCFAFQLFFPLGLAANIFSTQGVLPFTPNLARFTYVLLVLSVLVGMTLVVSLNWTLWFRPILDCMNIFGKRTSYYDKSPVGEQIHNSTTSPRWLEEGIVSQEIASLPTGTFWKRYSRCMHFTKSFEMETPSQKTYKDPSL
jgi:hypothetical protein